MPSATLHDDFPCLAGSYGDVGVTMGASFIAPVREVGGEWKVGVMLKIEGVAAEELVDVGVWFGNGLWLRFEGRWLERSNEGSI